jgi:hypothetical protein
MLGAMPGEATTSGTPMWVGMDHRTLLSAPPEVLAGPLADRRLPAAPAEG